MERGKSLAETSKASIICFFFLFFFERNIDGSGSGHYRPRTWQKAYANSNAFSAFDDQVSGTGISVVDLFFFFLSRTASASASASVSSWSRVSLSDSPLRALGFVFGSSRLHLISH